ncbi:MAG: ABC transporter permease [Xanthomonadales bacterium]|nr:ABC transporter permease [Xanthomonadales bacterium]
MDGLGASLLTAVDLIVHLDREMVQIIVLTFQVNVLAALIGCAIAFPLGAAVAVLRFPGRGLAIALLNAGMSLSGVVIGLVVYLILSRSGPLGGWGLLFSPTAMVIAQVVMITPIVAALTCQTVADLDQKYDEQLRSLGAGRLRKMLTLLWDGRFSLVTAALAGFGRALAEVGTVMIVGGNIAHHTRVMTNAIMLETDKGDLPLAVALGIVLLLLTLVVTLLIEGVREVASRRYA